MPPSDNADLLEAEADLAKQQPWPVTPLLRVDSELKVSLLVLLGGIRTDPTATEFDGEYHRFAAVRPIERASVLASTVVSLIPVAELVPQPAAA